MTTTIRAHPACPSREKERRKKIINSTYLGVHRDSSPRQAVHSFKISLTS
ncbi:hypothetical protein ACE6H2_001373 [Prunus campanulata]